MCFFKMTLAILIALTLVVAFRISLFPFTPPKKNKNKKKQKLDGNYVKSADQLGKD